MRINAHRGDPLRHRENTMPAFESAYRLGADCIELDIHASLDACAVVSHDATLMRLWGIEQAAADLTYDEIFSMTNQAETKCYVPHLAEVLSSFDISVMVDFTQDDAVEPIVEILKQQSSMERCIVSSGNIVALKEIRKALPSLAIALTWNDIRQPSDGLLQELDVQYFNPNFHIYQDSFIATMLRVEEQVDRSMHPTSMVQLRDDMLERRRLFPAWYALDEVCGSGMIEKMHQTGRKTSAWTVDDPAVMREMLAAGIDLITTNDTKTLVEVRNERRTQADS